MTKTFRIGQIVPSSNTTMETEIPLIFRRREQDFADRFTFHSSRMRMHRVTPEELKSMNAQGVRCAAELADARVDVMSTACLVAIMAQGRGFHRQVESDFAKVVAENAAHSKVMTSAGALIYGLHKLGAKKISLMAPYMKALTAKVIDYIEGEGIEVVDSLSFEIPDNLEVGRRDPAQLLENVKQLNTANVDVVVLSACVQMPSLPAVQQAQQMLGLPVTSTAVCTARNMLDLLELDARVPGFGRLLEIL
ncbi:Asp/Glu racemase [Achromobacter sp.]|uniref:maleate cis-trans isomerase family protein n=1 Tax=Achromobacter sp. TaxID=134375 RepID=UPI0028A9E82D|nr:Asp/Glu racemase [Achromobacter sp.]